MEVFHHIDDLSSIDRPLHLAVGVFDGLHVGHQAVIRQAVEVAAESGGVAMLVTFEPHPRSVLRPEATPGVLTNAEHKLRLAEQLGVSRALIVRFDETFAQQPGRDFIVQIATAAPDLRQISVGAGWKFGCNRSGDLDLLQSLGAEFGFSVSGAETVRIGDETVSSTVIRQAVRTGDFAHAAKLLGRDYSVFGEVIQGQRRGRRIGFPTANLAVAHEELPPGGVYAVRAELRGRKFDGVANLGVRPTVAEPGAQRLLEVHLFDFDQAEFYGENLEVWFVERLREEKKFDSIEDLVAQIERDATEARRMLREP